MSKNFDEIIEKLHKHLSTCHECKNQVEVCAEGTAIMAEIPQRIKKIAPIKDSTT